MRFEFLGQVAIVCDGRRYDAHGEQPAITLARLVLERPTPLWRDELAELLWPIRPPQHWEGPARQVVSRARALLVRAGAPPECITSQRGRTELTLAADIQVDVEDALHATNEAEAALARGDAEGAVRASDAALARLRLPFFPNSDAMWTRRWQDRIRGHVGRSLHAGATANIALGLPAQAIPHAEEALELDPYDEAATRVLMAAYEALGSRGNALAAYERCRRLLDEELGVRPSDATEAAYLALLGRAPRAAAPAGSAPRALEQPVDMLPFVGRTEERSALERAWAAARGGAARAVIIEGEPGIGKTRLASQVSIMAQADGALVLWGACVADVELPHQPFGDVVAQLLADRPPAQDALGPLAHDLAALVPDLIDRAPTRDFDDYARDRLFRAVAAAFGAVENEPLLFVIDDLQWAGDDAMALLRHLIPQLATRPCLLVITVREAAGRVSAALADIHRMIPATALHLQGLSVDDLVEMLDASGVTMRDNVRTVAAEVRARTTGNPFYVSQLVGAANAAKAVFDPAAVPNAITELVTRRLDALDRERATTLALAALVGDEFAFDIMEACSPLDADRLLEVIEEFCRQRLLEEREPGEFAFAHALVRDAVLSTVGATRRQRMHRRIGDALAANGADAAVLAHHYVGAGAGAAREAAAWSYTAGTEALAGAAWTVAREHFHTAAALALDIDDRCAALVGLGRAQRALGDAVGGRATLEEALAIAQSHRRGRAAAAATLALVGGGGRGVAVDLADAERTALLRDALAGLDAEDRDVLVPVLGELALSLVLTEAKEERDLLTERAVSVARQTQHADILATALWTRRVALMGPAGTGQRAADAREILAFAHGDIAPERRIAAELALVEDLLELGDRAGARAALAGAVALADRLAHPYWSWATTCWRALDAIIDDNLGRAEVLAFEALGFQAPAEHPEAVAALGVNLVDIRLCQGRAAENIDLLRGALQANPHIPAYRAVLALCCAEAGELVCARDAVQWFAAHKYALPPDSNWLLGTAVLADAAVTIGDTRAADTLARALAPYADRHIVLNCFGGGGAYWGPVSYQLARCALLAGRADDARTLLERAVDAAEAFGAPRFAQRARDALKRATRA